jgi:hypothetical protein
MVLKAGAAILCLILFTADLANAAEINMRVFRINDHLLCFYDGRPAESAVPDP